MMEWAEKLSEYSWQKVLAIGLGVAALYYFLLFDSGEGFENRVLNLQNQVNEQTTLLNETKKALEDAKQFEDEVSRITAQFNEVIQFLPTNLTVADLMKALTAEAAASGTEIIKVEPKSKGNRKDFYETMSIDLELEGSYSQLVLFLSFLSKVPRLLTFDKITLTKAANTDLENARIRFAGTLIAYRYSPEPDGQTAGENSRMGQNPNVAQ